MNHSISFYLLSRLFKVKKKFVIVLCSLLFLSGFLYGTGWILPECLKAYNEKCANSTGVYDFVQVGSQGRDLSNLATLVSLSSQDQALWKNQEIILEFSTHPEIQYPELANGTYPKEGEILISGIISLFYDLNVGDFIPVQIGKDLKTFQVSGIIRSLFEKWIVFDSNPPGPIYSNWYSLLSGVTPEQIDTEILTGITFNQQRLSYRYSDQTNRILASQVIKFSSIFFVFFILIIVGFLIERILKQSNSSLVKAGMSPKNVRKMNQYFLFGIEIINLFLGMGMSLLIWKCALYLFHKPTSFLNTLVTQIPFHFSATSGMAASGILVALIGFTYFVTLKISFSKKRKSLKKEKEILGRIYTRPFYPNFFIGLTALLLSTQLVIGESMCIFFQTPLPKTTNESSIGLSCSIEFKKVEEVQEFFQFSQNITDGLSFKLDGEVFLRPPNFVLPTSDSVAAQNPPMIVLDSIQYEKFFPTQKNEILLVSPEKIDIKNAWFMVSSRQNSDLNTLNAVLENKREIMEEKEVISLSSQDLSLPNYISVYQPTIFIPLSRLKELVSQESFSGFVSLYSHEEIDRFFQNCFDFLKNYSISNISGHNQNEVVDQIRLMNLSLINLVSINAIILELATLFSWLILYWLYLQTQWPNIQKWMWAGMTKKQCIQFEGRNLIISALLACIGSLPFFLLNPLSWIQWLELISLIVLNSFLFISVLGSQIKIWFIKEKVRNS